MLFCASIENQTLLFGVFDGKILLHRAQIAADVRASAYDYAVRLREILALWGLSPDGIDGAAIASVVPALTGTLREACTLAFSVSALCVSAGVRTGLKISRYANTLGADFVCNAAAAKASFPLPAVLVSVGTATTFAALDETGAFLGTAITAGPNTSAAALHKEAAQLPQVALERPATLIASDTASALQSGLCYGHAAMVDGMVKRFSDAIGGAKSFLLTGEYADWLAPFCETPFLVERDLVLEGLRLIAEKNAR